MKKNKFRITLDFDLNTKPGEVLNKNSVSYVTAYLKNWFVDRRNDVHYFHADHKDYDTDVSPVNVKVSVKKRK
jgi:hypothetical protein